MRTMQTVTAFILAAVLLTAGAAGTVQPAYASWDWCWDDPILLIDGKRVNINVGVLGDPALIKSRVQLAHSRILLPTRVQAQVAGFTHNHFLETAEIVRVDWLQYEPGKKVEMEIYVSFRVARGAPEMDARVDVTRDGYRYAGNSGKTTVGVKVQHQITN